MAKKLILVGIDAAIPSFVKRFAEDGYLPNIVQLIRKGTFCYALPTCPTHTPTNWTTIATGAYPGTHGIVGFADIHLPGEPLDKLHVGFDTRLCQAEYIWNTAERVGKKVILLKYPASWPPTLKNGIQVEGYGRPAVHNPWLLSRACCYNVGKTWTEDLRTGKAEYIKEVLAYGHRWPVDIHFREAQGWSHLPASHKPLLETVLPVIAFSKSKEQVDFYCLMFDKNGTGYDTLLISPSKDATQAVATLAVGDWSGDIRTEFTIDGTCIPATFRFKLIELSPNGEEMLLYQTQINSINGWTVPESLGEELWQKVGGFLESTADAIIAREVGWIDDHTYLEEYTQQANWLAKAARYLLNTYSWDLFFTQIHHLDTTKHAIWGFCDPVSEGHDPQQADRYWKIMAGNYEIADLYVGELMQVTDEDTIMVVVSDHGHVDAGKPIMINNLLARYGLIDFKIDPTTGKAAIDWTKTKAYAPVTNAYGINIFVNLKGRDPQGIVETGSQYEEIREQILALLHNFKDPQTGLYPVALALKKEDAALVGLWGDRVGDIIWFRRPEYDTSGLLTDPPVVFGRHALEGSAHGGELPTARYSIGSMNAVFIIAGPGVKRGYERPKPVCLTDVAPTIAHLLGLPMPAQAEGKVLHDIFENRK